MGPIDHIVDYQQGKLLGADVFHPDSQRAMHIQQNRRVSNRARGRLPEVVLGKAIHQLRIAACMRATRDSSFGHSLSDRSWA